MISEINQTKTLCLTSYKIKKPWSGMYRMVTVVKNTVLGVSLVAPWVKLPVLSL